MARIRIGPDVRIESTDFNGAGRLIADRYPAQWKEVEEIIEAMPLQVYGSDEAGKQGNLIFNVKGTNSHLKDAFLDRDWGANVQIPAAYRVLGTDVDFVKDGVLVEAQFSNYPFLSNNILRSDVFFKNRVPMGGGPVGLLLIITKAWMFPASQGTLYYEQAVNQLRLLLENGAFEVPARVIGMFEERNSIVDAVWTKYTEARHSRTEAARENRRVRISPGTTARSRDVLAPAEGPDAPPDPGPSLFGE